MTSTMIESNLERLAALDSNTVSDALDFLGLPGATFGLRPLWNCRKIVGRASTIQFGPKTAGGATVHPITPVIAASQGNDRILVIAGGLDVCRAGATWSPMQRRSRVSAAPSSTDAAATSTE